MDTLPYANPQPPSNMPATSVVTGALLIALGVVLSLVASQHGSKIATALIPAYVGIVFVALGVLSRTPTLRKHLMHVAAGLALLLALAGLGMGLPKLIQYYANTLPIGAAVRPLAWWGQVIMAAVLAIFLVLAIRSFIAARRWRQANV